MTMKKKGVEPFTFSRKLWCVCITVPYTSLISDLFVRKVCNKYSVVGVIFLKKRCKKGPSKVWWFSLGHFLKENVTFSRAFSVVEWTCFRSKNCVPSTQYPVPSTQYPVPSTQYPVPSTQYPVPSTQYPVPSTQYPVPSTQYPVPSTQYPVPSTQYPVPSTQYPVPKGRWRVPRRR